MAFRARSVFAIETAMIENKDRMFYSIEPNSTKYCYKPHRIGLASSFEIFLNKFLSIDLSYFRHLDRSLHRCVYVCTIVTRCYRVGAIQDLNGRRMILSS